MGRGCVVRKWMMMLWTRAQRDVGSRGGYKGVGEK